MIDLSGHMPRFYFKNECFPIYVLDMSINVCWNPQNRACFSNMIDLSGHIPRFTLKMTIFSSMSLASPYMCDETLKTGLVFPDMIDL